MADIQTDSVDVRLVGELPVKLWGLSLEQWQTRKWKKLGAGSVTPEGEFCIGSDWILSPALATRLLETPGAVLVVKEPELNQERIAVVHSTKVPSDETVKLVNSVNPDWEELRKQGFTPGYMEDFVGEYDKALRKREAPYALSLFQTTPEDVERRLFKGSYKGVTDLVTKYAWPVPALHVTRLCANLRLTPNMVTTVGLVLVCLAFYLFYIGAWLPAIAAGWVMTFLDTVDGKLARTTMTYSAWGNIYDHGIDLIHPPFWYWAMYVGLIATGAAHPWLLPALIIILVGYVVGRVIEGIFIGAHKIHIHVWRPVDAFMREITARRNPNLLIFMVFTIFGAPLWGFFAIAIWTVICIAFHTIRLLQSAASKSPVTSFMDA